MTISQIRIATRESDLALWQANFVKDELAQLYPELLVELVPMTTEGDKRADIPLADIGGKGLFLKELEVAMQRDRADIAVHSLKDIPIHLDDEFCIAAVCKRSEVRDAFVSKQYESFAALPAGAVLGTSSTRRQCWVNSQRDDLEIRSIRGNMITRLRKLDDEDFDALIMAGVGLQRLGLSDRIRHYFSVDEMLPAAGQGAVAIECLSSRQEIRDLIGDLNHVPTEIRMRAERSMTEALNGGCKLPIAAYAEITAGQKLNLRGMAGTTDGQTVLTGTVTGKSYEAEKLGLQLADQLIAQGAKKILNAFDFSG